MVEQLNLRLEPALPRPGDVAPMWPTARPDPFDSSDYLFEPTWGGHRVLAFVGPSERPGDGAVRIVDPTGRDLADRLPELAGLAVRVAARSAVLDGELVVVDAKGRADDDALRERLNGKPGRPVAYLVFDVLHLDGKWLLNLPLDKRRLGAAAHPAAGRRGGGRARDRRRGSRAPRGGDRAGHRRRARAAPDEPLPAGRAQRAVALDHGRPDARRRTRAPGPRLGRGPIAATGPRARRPVLALFRRLPFEEDAAE